MPYITTTQATYCNDLNTTNCVALGRVENIMIYVALRYSRWIALGFIRPWLNCIPKYGIQLRNMGDKNIQSEESKKKFKAPNVSCPADAINHEWHQC